MENLENDLIEVLSEESDTEEFEFFPTNKLSAKYKLYAVGDSDIYTEITSGKWRESDVTTEIHSRATRNKDITTEIISIYRGNSDIGIEIQPIGYFNMETEIYVRPHNKMTAIYEVVQPPLVDNVNEPVMDAFTRSKSEFATINYGSSSSIVVGNNESEKWNSYLKFDLSHIIPSLPITGSKLRLYYSGAIPPNAKIELYDLSENWQEYSITYLNSPNLRSFITDEYTHNPTSKYIEFNVSETALEWINNPKRNQGFMLKTEDIIDGQFIFKSRESFNPPELIVTHYDTSVFSRGRSEVITIIEAVKRDFSQKPTEIEVGSTFEFERLNTEIYVHRKEVPLDQDVEMEIISNKNIVPTEITCGIRKTSDIQTSIDVISGINTSIVFTEISISRPVIESELFVKYKSDVLTVISASHDSRRIEITVNKDKILSEITVPFTEENLIDSELTVSRDSVLTEITSVFGGNSDIETVIETTSANVVEAEIVVSRPNVLTEVRARAIAKNELNTRIDVNRPFILTEIRTPERSEVLTEIQGLPQNSIETEVTVSKYKVEFEITSRVLDHSEIESELYVKWVDKVEIEIDARSTSKTLVEISVKATSNIASEITVSRPTTPLEITPRVKGEHDVLTVLEPRIFMVNNLETIITVGGRKGAYGFVM